MERDLYINLPDQDHPSDDFPIHPRKIRQWIKQLPLVNMGEATRQFYSGLSLVNRKLCAPKLRLEIMEALRPTARIILSNLHKHLVAHNLPLPPKTLQIFQLCHALLSELVIGYKTILRDTTTGTTRLNDIYVTLSIHRTMRYLGEQLSVSARVYASIPEGIWRDINQLFQLSEEYGLLHRSTDDCEHHLLEKSSILDVYKQINLLAMSQLHSLQQGEVEKLTAFFERASADCTISEDPVLDYKGNIHYINTNLDAPPDYTIKAELALSSANRYFDLSSLVDNLVAMIQGEQPDQVETIVSLPTLSRDLTRRLLSSLTTNPKRRFNRTLRSSKILVAIGLANIHAAFKESQHNIDSERSLDVQSPQDFSLQLYPKQTSKHENALFTHAEERSGSSYAWDMIAKGNLVTGQPINGDEQAIHSDESSSAQRWQTWDMVNQSVGGCRLLWRESLESKARVGELLVLRNPHKESHRYQVGVIRWMRYYNNLGLEIGLQVLAPDVLPASATFKSAQNHRKTQSTDVLMLSGVEALNQPPSVITYPNLFQEGDRLVIKLVNHAKQINQETEVELENTCTRKSTYNQFHYICVSEIKHTLADIKDKDKFGAVWSAL
jgi:hypothetical protein